jgi:hypothetical protein
MALTQAQTRQVAASWADIQFSRTGDTASHPLDDIMSGVTQIDAGMSITGGTINSTFTVTGPMATMTTRQTSIMVALVMQMRVGLA